MGFASSSFTLNSLPRNLNTQLHFPRNETLQRKMTLVHRRPIRILIQNCLFSYNYSTSRRNSILPPKSTQNTSLPSHLPLSKQYNRDDPKTMNSLASLALVVTAMLVVQIVFAGSQILTSLALKQGGFLLALLTYRHLVAAAFIGPIAVYLDREHMKDLRKGRVWFWASLTAFTGITMGMGLFYYGVRDTSAAYATNYSNLIPIITYIFSVIIRTEKLELSKLSGKAKAMGTFMCVGGAVLIGLYDGPTLIVGRHNLKTAPPANMVRGTILLVASCFGYALWFVVQAKLLSVLPSKHLSNFLTCWIAALQCGLLGVCLDRTTRSWALGWNVALLCVLTSGIFASAVAFYLILWAVQIKDPSYPSMFDPFSVVFVAVIQALFFGDRLTVGLLIGMVIMIVGLYGYMWGKREEEKAAAVLPTVSVSVSPPPEINNSDD